LIKSLDSIDGFPMISLWISQDTPITIPVFLVKCLLWGVPHLASADQLWCASQPPGHRGAVAMGLPLWVICQIKRPPILPIAMRCKPEMLAIFGYLFVYILEATWFVDMFWHAGKLVNSGVSNSHQQLEWDFAI
jgi:hypothetical protein